MVPQGGPSARAESGLPALPQPVVASGAFVQGTADGTADIVYSVPAGWSAVSFPLTRLVAVRGLTHQIVSHQGGSWKTADAGAAPQEVDTRFGWLVYAEAPLEFTVTGVAQEVDSVTVPLAPGWSLIGNPFPGDLAWANTTLTTGASLLGPLTNDGTADTSLPRLGARWVRADEELDLGLHRVVPEPVTVGQSAAAAPTGTLSGKVQTSSGVALRSATIRLDNGQSATSAADGTFRIASVPAGTRTLTASATNYKTAQGTVTIRTGQTTSVLISLSPVVSPPQTTGTLNVAAYAWYYSGSRYWPYRIEVQEYGNYSKRWSNTWYTDYGYSRTDLPCTGANVGRSHTIRITWRASNGSQYSNTWYRTLNSTYQTEYFYNP